MSIFHLTVKRGSRSKNRLAVDKHDYIVRLGRFAQRHDGDLAHSENGNMPGWAQSDPHMFWVETDEHERANATLYHEIEFALPVELSPAQQIECTREFVRQICGEQHPYSWGLHAKENNPHVHLMFSGRMLDGIERDAELFFKRYNSKSPERGGCRKEASGDARGRDWVKQVRMDWQDVANRYLAASGQNTRIDHRSYKDQGLEIAPGVHLGRKAHRLEKAGRKTVRGLENRERASLNSSLAKIREKTNPKPHPQKEQTYAAKRTTKPYRAFTAWRDRPEDHPGLRASRRAGPERMPGLRQSSSGAGRQEARDTLLPSPVQGHRGIDSRVHRHGPAQREIRRERANRNACSCRDESGRASKPAFAIAAMKAEARHGRTLYRWSHGAAAGLPAIVDRGDKLTLIGKASHPKARALIELAKAKGWEGLVLTGSDEFKRLAIREALREGVRIANPELVSIIQEEKNLMNKQTNDQTRDELARRWLMTEAPVTAIEASKLKGDPERLRQLFENHPGARRFELIHQQKAAGVPEPLLGFYIDHDAKQQNLAGIVRHVGTHVWVEPHDRPGHVIPLSKSLPVRPGQRVVVQPNGEITLPDRENTPRP